MDNEALDLTERPNPADNGFRSDEAIKRGQVWVANLNPDRGAEAGKIRPVLIIQGDWLSEAQSRTVVVLPLTTGVRPETEPLRVRIRSRDGLREDSHVLVEQPPYARSRKDWRRPLTELSADEIRQVEQSLLAVLGIFRES